jgi:hypothetical protein
MPADGGWDLTRRLTETLRKKLFPSEKMEKV